MTNKMEKFVKNDNFRFVDNNFLNDFKKYISFLNIKEVDYNKENLVNKIIKGAKWLGGVDDKFSMNNDLTILTDNNVQINLSFRHRRTIDLIFDKYDEDDFYGDKNYKYKFKKVKFNFLPDKQIKRILDKKIQYKSNFLTDYTFNSKEDFIKSCLRNIVIKLEDCKYPENGEFKQRALNVIFDSKESFIPDCDKGYWNSDYYLVKKVFENDKYSILKNKRIALLGSAGEDKLVLYKPEDKGYNYIDKKRVLCERKFSSISDNKNMIYFDDKLSETLIENGFNIDSDIFKDENIDNIIVGKDKYENFKKQQKLKKKRSEQKEKKKKMLKKKKEEMKKKFIEGEKDELMLGDIKLTPSYIEYNNRRIGGENYDIRNELSFLDGKRVDLTDFNNWLKSICQGIYHKYNKNKLYHEEKPFSHYTKLEVINENGNKIIANVDVKLSKNECQLYYINGERINKNEVQTVLRDIVCMENQNSFDKYLSKISKCSLRYREYMANGVVFDVDIGITSRRKTAKMRFDIERENRKFYLVINKDDGKERYRINRMNEFLRKTVEKKTTTSLEKLYNYFLSVFDISNEEVEEILKYGLRKYRETIKRSKILLEETIQALDVEKTKKDFGNSVKKGYVVTSNSNNKYFVTNNLNVYTLPDKNHICIVEKNMDNGLPKNDKLVTRLYSLKNDNRMVKDIHTLKKNLNEG